MKRLFQLLIALGTVLWLGAATGSGARVIINLSEQRAYLSFTSSRRVLFIRAVSRSPLAPGHRSLISATKSFLSTSPLSPNISAPLPPHLPMSLV